MRISLFVYNCYRFNGYPKQSLSKRAASLPPLRFCQVLVSKVEKLPTEFSAHVKRDRGKVFKLCTAAEKKGFVAEQERDEE